MPTTSVLGVQDSLKKQLLLAAANAKKSSVPNYTAGVATVLDGGSMPAGSSASTWQVPMTMPYSTAKTTSTSGSSGVSGVSNTSNVPAEQVSVAQTGPTQQELAAQEAQRVYDANLTALTNAYNTRKASLDSGYKDTFSQLVSAYQRGNQNISTDAEKSLQDVYLNEKLAQRDLPQLMTAQGLSGGASESSIASLKNSAGNSRNAIATTQNTNIAELEASYNNSLADARNTYEAAVAAAEQEKANYLIDLNNTRSNQQINSYNLGTESPTYGTLSTTPYSSTVASNTMQSVTTPQTEVENPALKLKNENKTDTEIIKTLYEQGYTQDQITEFLTQLYS